MKPPNKPSSGGVGNSPSAEQATQLAALFGARRYGDTVALARTLAEQFPAHGMVWKVLGVATYLGGDNAGALAPLERAAALLPADAEPPFHLGMVMRATGRAAQAEGFFRRALQLQPQNAYAHGYLGDVLAALGRPAEAQASYTRALELKPNLADVHCNLGVLLKSQGQLANAEAHYRAALALRPNDAEILSNLGNLLTDTGQHAHAEASLRQAVHLQPGHAQAHNNLGRLLLKLKRPAEARASCCQALALQPAFPEAFNMLGNVCAAQGEHHEAMQAYQRALAIAPQFVEAISNLGVAQTQLGMLAEALTSQQRALLISPDHAPAHLNLGVVLHKLGRLQDAEASYRHCLQLGPASAEAHNNLGQLLLEQRRHNEAAQCFTTALTLDPDCVPAHVNLGGLLQEQGRFAQGEVHCRRALALRPDSAEACNNLGRILKDMGRHDEALASYVQALRIRPDYVEAHSNLLFSLNYHPDKRAQDIFQAYTLYDQTFGLPHRAAWRAHGNNREAGRPLRVGYVSPDFRQHACRYFLEPLLAHHDKARFSVFAYAELSAEDETTARYRGYADRWIPTRGMSDEALAQRIRDDGVDILVDLAGHTRGNRLQVFARKPAPVSVSWLGFGCTTGLSAIDHFLTDGFATPAGSDALFSESPWRLDGPAFAYRPAPGMGEAGPLPASRCGTVTFGTLSRAVRLNHHTLRAWAEILRRVEGSRLLLDSGDFRDADMQARIANALQAYGIARERLDIGYHSPPWDVLRGIDISLDCFPHNSGTTLFESLYMGVPFVTLAGRAGVGRLGHAILQGAGCAQWVAHSVEDYVALAVSLAQDLPALAAIRAGLRARMEGSPLMNEPAFAHSVERAYSAMWRQWCEAAQP